LNATQQNMSSWLVMENFSNLGLLLYLVTNIHTYSTGTWSNTRQNISITSNRRWRSSFDLVEQNQASPNRFLFDRVPSVYATSPHATRQQSAHLKNHHVKVTSNQFPYEKT